MYVDAPKTILEIAERRKVFSVGVHQNGIAHAPKGYLTGAEWSWDRILHGLRRQGARGESFGRASFAAGSARGT